jgi:hypothetical protein
MISSNWPNRGVIDVPGLAVVPPREPVDTTPTIEVLNEPK